MGKIDRDVEGGDPKRTVAFSASPVLPGEDQREYQSLVDELRGQYEPVGPIEQSVVTTIANAIFRKRHLTLFQRAFIARMKWGSFFEYAGDPVGSARITESDRQLANATYVEAVTKFVTERVKAELAKMVADGTQKSELIKFENEVSYLFASDPTKTPEEQLEANTNEIVEKAIVEIKEKRLKRSNLGPMNYEDIVKIVRGITQTQLEASIKQLRRNGPLTSRGYETSKSEAVDKFIEVFDVAFGPGTIKKMMEPICREGIEKSLAELGALLTPERYEAELRFNELLDVAIERNHDRLMKYQAARAKRPSGSIRSLQPDWARKR